jgi:hypothetical protein
MTLPRSVATVWAEPLVRTDADHPDSNLATVRTLLLIGPALVGLALFYWWAGPSQANTDPFAPLAAAFIQGHLYLDGEPRTWLELVPAGPGQWYVPFPPGPALVLLPVVAIAGAASVDTNLASAIAGAVDVGLMFGLLGRLGLDGRGRIALTVGLAIGSELLWGAATAGTHLFPQVLAFGFATIALWLVVDGRWPLSAGIALGAAAACRLPVGLAAAGLAFLLARQRPASVGSFVIGIAVVAVPVAVYNVARFGSPIDFGYAGITSWTDGHHPTDEPWFSDGLVSLAYLPRGLNALLLQGFNIGEGAPWLKPSWAGAAVTFTMPALFWIVRSRWRDPLVIGLSVAAVGALIPDLLHGSTGFSQFGYRFILDALPFLWVLLALVIVRRGWTRLLGVALVAGVVVNLYGLWAIWGIDFVSF